MAETEKKRFANERDALCKAHKGPLARKIRAKKNPLAPKRPMSAFLMYAQQKRRPLQTENPAMSNADISRLLGEMWRNASPSLDRRQDVATFIREGGESHSRFGKSRIRNVSISPLLCTVISPNLLPTPPPLKILDRACCYRRRHIQRMHPLLIGFITRLPKTIIIIITIIVEPTAVVPMSTDMIHRLGLHYRRLHSMQQPPQQRERFTA
ncbi:hypothetical protein ACHAXH_004085 [Discostella pseudostelligera]